MRIPMLAVVAGSSLLALTAGCNPNPGRDFVPPAGQQAAGTVPGPSPSSLPMAPAIGQEPGELAAPREQTQIRPNPSPRRPENFTRDPERGAPVGRHAIRLTPHQSETTIPPGGTTQGTTGQTQEAQRQAGEVGKQKELDIRSNQLKWGTSAGKNVGPGRPAFSDGEGVVHGPTGPNAAQIDAQNTQHK